MIQEIKSDRIKEIILNPEVNKAKITTSENEQIEMKLPLVSNYMLPLIISKDIAISVKPNRNKLNLETLIKISQEQELSNLPEVTYSEFIDLVRNYNKLELFYISKNRDQGKAIAFDGSQFKVYLPKNGSATIDILSENGVGISFL